MVFFVFIATSMAAAKSQSTFRLIYDLFRANCSSGGCHVSASNPIFNAEGSESDLYASLVNALPVNPTARAKGYKLVDPGHPYNSFLLYKIGSDLDPYLTLGPEFGERTPQAHSTLNDYDIELVRQWILMGAPQTGNKVNYPLLVEYYTQGGFDMLPIPATPSPLEGMQVRVGPIFLAPGEEVEWDIKQHLRNQNTLKVYRTEGFMSWQSHHMLLFKYNGDGSGVREGLRRVPTEAFPFNGDVTLTGAWQNDDDFILPEGTAFFWRPNTVLDFDYHIKNYSNTEILPSDFYLNIYFDTSNTRNIEMHAKLVNNAALLLFRGDNSRVASENFHEDRYIYMMSSHLHKWGTDFDVYLKNADGSRGAQIYEGFFNEDYSFNQGYYDWEHPPIRYFNPMPKASYGLEYTARWNVGVPFVTFGLTADDEMMLFTYLYTKEEVPQLPAASPERVESSQITLSPNPFTTGFHVDLHLDHAAKTTIELRDVPGKKIMTHECGLLQPGNHQMWISSELMPFSGIYFVIIRINGEAVKTEKITKI
ncbi:MAG: hypothetical protein KatS3mg031_1691 [Chitinophagales bacterium]|nr:MAG: hypothetical protein KatS3mg031_1691 [Chitinophagales bacterium]